MEVDLLLRGGILLASADAAPVHDAAIAIDGGRIVDIGKSEAVSSSVTPRHLIDCAHQVIMPGLIDSHIHTCQQLGRGLADDINVLEWLAKMVDLESNMTEVDVNVSAKAACLEMIKGGTTGFIEGCGNPLYPDAMGEAVKEAGLRAVLTRSTMEFAETDWKTPDTFVMDAQTNLEATRKLIKTWNGAADGRISAWSGWRQQWNLSNDLLVALVELARENGAGLHGHLATRRFGQVDLLDRLGVLGPDLVFAHGIHFTARDRRLLRTNNVKIAHNPGTSMHCGYGASVVGCFPEMVAEGITVALGCDGAAANNTLDMFQAMRQVASVHKEVRMDPRCISPQAAFKMGTKNGALAANWPTVGTLEVGNQADVITVNMRQPHLMPAHNPLNNIVYSAGAQDVMTTIVAGKVLMEDREVKSLNESRVLDELDASSTALLKRITDHQIVHATR